MKKNLIGDFEIPPAGWIPDSPEAVSYPDDPSTNRPDDDDDIGIPPAG